MLTHWTAIYLTPRIKHLADPLAVALSDIAGGCTATAGKGLWNSVDTGELIREDVLILKTYHRPDDAAAIASVLQPKVMHALALGEESVAIETEAGLSLWDLKNAGALTGFALHDTLPWPKT